MYPSIQQTSTTTKKSSNYFAQLIVIFVTDAIVTVIRKRCVPIRTDLVRVRDIRFASAAIELRRQDVFVVAAYIGATAHEGRRGGNCCAAVAAAAVRCGCSNAMAGETAAVVAAVAAVRAAEAIDHRQRLLLPLMELLLGLLMVRMMMMMMKIMIVVKEFGMLGLHVGQQVFHCVECSVVLCGLYVAVVFVYYTENCLNSRSSCRRDHGIYISTARTRQTRLQVMGEPARRTMTTNTHFIRIAYLRGGCVYGAA